MATGACGIDCDTCRLNILGICSTCGPGTSREALEKLDVQKRVLGAPCPILACAVAHRIAHCIGDCDDFPCGRFRNGPYPFSDAYLDMQKRRRTRMPPARSPSGGEVTVPGEYWETLGQSDIRVICENALARNYPPVGVLLPFLSVYLLVDIQRRRVCRQGRGQWEAVDDPLLELLCLVYLLNAGPWSPGQKMVSVRELKTGHFFQGPHELNTAPLLERYGGDLAGFKRAAEALGGEPLDLADAAYRFLPFPKIPLYYLLWKGDPEFRPRVSILFDRSIEQHLAVDAIWGLANMVSDLLLKEGDPA